MRDKNKLIKSSTFDTTSMATSFFRVGDRFPRSRNDENNMLQGQLPS